MRFKHFVLAFALIGLTFSLNTTARAGGQPEALARNAVSANASESAPAIAELRAMGPAGLQTLLSVYSEQIKRHNASPDAFKADEDWRRISAALDAVSQQYDSATSGLYWYTDFAQAQAASRQSGKPILSLRLLGNLNEEYSCANSRFFRTVLYANTQVSNALRERFILHWKSVRPVPRVTVDYGDGRKLERTLTGNSIHYILDSEGRPVDALPGLYGPQAFLRELERVETLTKQLAKQDDSQRYETLRQYHQARIDALIVAWKADVVKTGGKIPAEITAAETSGRGDTPSARAASRLAMSKAVTEVGIINSITYEPKLLAQATDTETWNKIAALHSADAKLDESSLALMRRQNATNPAVPNTKSAPTAEQFTRLVQNFESYIALDTVRNEYLMRTKLQAWLLSPAFSGNLDRLNEKVYSELFLTPRTDPWLGLFSPDTYTALDGGGVNSN